MLSNSTDAKKPTWNLSMRLKPMKSSALLYVNFEFQSSSADGSETYLKPFAVFMNIILTILLVMVKSYINLV